MADRMIFRHICSESLREGRRRLHRRTFVGRQLRGDARWLELLCRERTGEDKGGGDRHEAGQALSGRPGGHDKSLNACWRIWPSFGPIATVCGSLRGKPLSFLEGG